MPTSDTQNIIIDDFPISYIEDLSRIKCYISPSAQSESDIYTIILTATNNPDDLYDEYGQPRNYFILQLIGESTFEIKIPKGKIKTAGNYTVTIQDEPNESDKIKLYVIEYEIIPGNPAIMEIVCDYHQCSFVVQNKGLSSVGDLVGYAVCGGNKTFVYLSSNKLGLDYSDMPWYTNFKILGGKSNYIKEEGIDNQGNVIKYIELYKPQINPVLFTISVTEDSGVEPEDLPKIISLERGSVPIRPTGQEITKNLSDLIGEFESDAAAKPYLDDMLNIPWRADFRDFKNFVYFGRAETIVNNAYKNISEYYYLSSSLSTLQQNSYDFYVVSQSMVNLYRRFSPYEKWLVSSMWDGWPKQIVSIYSMKYKLHHPTSSYVQQWYSSSLMSAQAYDSENRACLINYVPQFYFEYQHDNIMTNFIDFMGSYFDYIKLIIDNFRNIFSPPYDRYSSTIGDYFKFILDILGTDTADILNMISLYNKYAKNDSEIYGYNLSVRQFAKILSNIVYLYKTKGSIESINTLLNIFGYNIPYKLFKLIEKRTPKRRSNAIIPPDTVETVGNTGDFLSNTYIPIYNPPRILISSRHKNVINEMQFTSLNFSSGYLSSSPIKNYINRSTPDKSNFTYEARIKIGPVTSSYSASLWGEVNVSASHVLSFRYEPTSSSFIESHYTHKGQLVRYIHTSAVASISNVLINPKLYYLVYLAHKSSSQGNIEKIGIIEKDGINIKKHYFVEYTVSNNLVKYAFPYDFEFGNNYNLYTSSYFTGCVHEMKIYNYYLDNDILETHSLNPFIYSLKSENETKKLVAHWRVGESYDLEYTASLYDSSPWNNPFGNSASLHGFPSGTGSWVENYETLKYYSSGIGENLSNVIVVQDDEYIDFDNINLETSISISPIDRINDEIENSMFYVNPEAVAVPSDVFRSYYKNLLDLSKFFFVNKILTDDIFEKHYSEMELFVRDALSVVQKFVPIDVDLGCGIEIKSHNLERNRVPQRIHDTECHNTVSKINMYNYIKTLCDLSQFVKSATSVIPNIVAQTDQSVYGKVTSEIESSQGSVGFGIDTFPAFLTNKFYDESVDNPDNLLTYKISKKYGSREQLRYVIYKNKQKDAHELALFMEPVVSSSNYGSILDVKTSINDSSVVFFE